MGRRKSKSKRRKPKKQKEIPTAVASSSAPPPRPPPLWIKLPKDQNEIPTAVASSSASPPRPPPPWIELPRDVTANILQRLGAVEMLESAEKVCTIWRRVCQDPSMWRVIDMKNTGYMLEEMPSLCRLAVDRSQGQLIDLSIHHFGDDELLNYVVERSSHLKHLTLNNCNLITGEGLVKAVKRLPDLEELHLIITPFVLAADVEAIGVSCPTLMSFTFNKQKSNLWVPDFAEDDERMEALSNIYALAIAKTMPNLRHLRLFANCMNNEGLKAILDGCPHLESLDIRRCFDVDLSGDLGKRCCEQIKNLRRPSDSIADIESLGFEISDSGFSDIYTFDSYDDYGYYDDFDYYDDYGDDGIWMFAYDDI